MPAGRPSKYKPGMCDRALKLMITGASLHEVALDLDIAYDTFDRWRKRHKEFSDAIKRGISASQGWWEQQGKMGLRESRFNAVLWYMNMKNRFGWKDKTEVDANLKHLLPEKIRIEFVKAADGRPSTG